MTDPNPTVLLETLHQRKRVTKAEAADLAVQLKIDFDELLDGKFNFVDEALWEEAEKIATEVAAEAEKAVADRCEKLSVPREFAPGVTSLGWRGKYLLDDRKAELSCAARTVIEVRLKAAARQIERHTLAAMQKIVQPGMTARDAQAVIDDVISFDDLMQPVTYEEAENYRSKTSRTRSWGDKDASVARRMASTAEEVEGVDAEALRDDFRRLLD